MALLFSVMLVTAAGNTAMQSIMPAVGTALKVDDVFISLAFSWSALLWMLSAPTWARRSDRRGRKAMMSLGLTGFVASFALCGLMLWLGLTGILGATAALLLFAAARAIYGMVGSASPPAGPAHVPRRPRPGQRTHGPSVDAFRLRRGAGGSPAPPPLRGFPPPIRPWLLVGLLGGHAQAAMLGISGFLVLDRLHLRGDPEAATGPIGMMMMSGAIATLLAQWGLIPLLRMGPRISVLSGMVCVLAGTTLWSAAEDLHSISLGFALASLGFGLFRPGFTAGASLAVSRAEQGQVSGIVASAAGAAYVAAPAVGVWLYNTHQAIGFGAIIALAFAVLLLGWSSLATDEQLRTANR